MSAIQRVYAYLFALLVIALGALWHSNSKIGKVKDMIVREKVQFDEVMSVGQLISNHKQMVDAQNKMIDSARKGDLEMNVILSLVKKHKLKDPQTNSEQLSVKRTFSEKIIKLKLADEKLKSMIEFMLEIEALGSSVVTQINITRNPKNRDLWNADITVVQRIKKDEEV